MPRNGPIRYVVGIALNPRNLGTLIIIVSVIVIQVFQLVPVTNQASFKQHG